jgi:hypothetical protein
MTFASNLFIWSLLSNLTARFAQSAKKRPVSHGRRDLDPGDTRIFSRNPPDVNRVEI